MPSCDSNSANFLVWTPIFSISILSSLFSFNFLNEKVITIHLSLMKKYLPNRVTEYVMGNYAPHPSQNSYNQIVDSFCIVEETRVPRENHRPSAIELILFTLGSAPNWSLNLVDDRWYDQQDHLNQNLDKRTILEQANYSRINPIGI